MTTKLLVIVGPTGVGKTDLAIRLARALQGEIVNADSRQLYRGMDIGTAKPTPQQQAAVPHHLIDVADPDGEYSLAHFVRQAGEAIRDIGQKRGRLPILVGGTGQYVWAVLEGWQVPEVRPDPEIRARYEQMAEREGPENVFHELEKVDPVAARRIDSRNVRRVIRALEVFHGNQQQLSGEVETTKGRAKLRKIDPGFDTKIVGLTMPRAALYTRIDQRVDAMMRKGWLDEVKRLVGQGYNRRLPAMSGLGYGELLDHLDSKLSLEEAVAAAKSRTHKFARRQYTWFKPGDHRISWFDVSSESVAEDVLGEVGQWLSA
ncbi:MAG: tRNA (adenosine(37)-N6)-dimethylallyltransferase MiaA [Chloroflexi bacterium]|nr:tRNA (adenosine(37)-N6)-dimethylallyltransferase MiaA [Chloroflexota bacterium]MCI0791587.1 tRNA (adenosine(37)-N6)-dimethylallyltransferase MiaA [Chloroflexota bacterium]MCI0813419.1 tRNA (adenosine(37)-N6)-dimethylallyltransferase MiaA [Chloroflexota bacterium]MCI0869184.1 tRNA (adenosine(37)-N6)-dimethylallyltransferase MiaA [Chloroflexota bacterium]